jgi:colanic acid/amylovoran biosynthesis glycosyltransferase
MRIAYLVNAYPAVSHSFVRREIAALEAAGHSIVRVSVRRSGSPLVDPADRAEAERTTVLLGGAKPWLARLILSGIAASPSGLARAAGRAIRQARAARIGAAKMAAYLLEAAALAAICRRERVDHLRVHFGTNAGVVARLARAMGGPPFSVTIHGPDEFDAPERWDLRGLVAEGAFTVAITSFCAGQLMRWSDPADWDRIVVVPCAVDAVFAAGPAPAMPADGPRRLCTVARLAPQKGLPLLIDALAEARAAGVDLHLDLVGDGPARGALAAAVSAHGLQDRVIFHGALPGAAVARIIGESHAMVLPSFAEGLPVVFMEAMALARPVIATAIAGVPELVRNGENGWLVSSGSRAALVGALTEFARTPVERLAAMGAQARKDALAGHSTAVAVDRLNAALQRFA